MDSKSWFEHGKEIERERIIEIILQSELGDYDAGFLVAEIRGEQ
jgi:hypothetical protein